MRPRFSLLLIPVAAAQLGATDCGQVTRDPGFDLWCGDDLCTWKTVRGEVRRAPTWHAKDAGAELVGTDTAIAQLTPVASGDGTCLEFRLLARVDEDAELMLRVDVFGDGKVEREERIPVSNWDPFTFKLAIEAPYQGIRFEIAKRGTGIAVIGDVDVERIENAECAGLVPFANQAAPLGAPCELDEDCGSGMCRVAVAAGSFFGFGQLCVGCDPTAPACEAGEVCGFGEPLTPVQYVPTTCAPEADRALGELCLTDAECATGTCAGHRCSTCDVDTPCAGGETCSSSASWLGGPSVCGADEHRRTNGEPCTQHADCASGACTGVERKECADGRPCESPLHCPVTDGLEPGACTVVGVQGGTCQ